MKVFYKNLSSAITLGLCYILCGITAGSRFIIFAPLFCWFLGIMHAVIVDKIEEN
jgi:hypothetical protein